MTYGQTKIIITIGKDGTRTIDVLGSKGAECEALTLPLEQAFSGITEGKEIKPERYQQMTANEKARSTQLGYIPPK